MAWGMAWRRAGQPWVWASTAVSLAWSPSTWKELRARVLEVLYIVLLHALHAYDLLLSAFHVPKSWLFSLSCFTNCCGPASLAGVMVYVPVGWLHQVMNLAPCLQMAWDYFELAHMTGYMLSCLHIVKHVPRSADYMGLTSC